MPNKHEIDEYVQHVRNTVNMAKLKKHLMRERSIVMCEQIQTLVLASSQAMDEWNETLEESKTGRFMHTRSA